MISRRIVLRYYLHEKVGEREREREATIHRDAMYRLVSGSDLPPLPVWLGVHARVHSA